MKRGSSTILVEVTDGGQPQFDIDFIEWTEGDADIEAEQGMLSEAINATGFDPIKPGHYIIEGFTAFYNKDYDGEVDATYSYDRSFFVKTTKYNNVHIVEECLDD
jgi:hypothetical protein